MEIRNTGMGIEVSQDYTTDLGNNRCVIVTVNPEKGSINVCATCDLNADGIQAFDDVWAMAKIIAKKGLDLPG